ncbi:putative sugar transferase EpsL [Rosistilla ulvae]|uniref:Putative sugar transferase EpsL n=1 Tax=Rosistilla ulvae TaxID=1930277 RepID=A0A517LX89_9BACT|nr:sugar transferase [Rosistilla ulvae]QDS87238.1 putative sugar transferase EpsL [Rosistilla ulvae]
MRRRFIRSLFDRGTAIVLLILFAPFLATISLLIAAFLGAPVLFRQPRTGLDGTPFTLLKFRTMRDATDANGNPLSDDQRMTRLGRLLRAASIDELPALWNVIRGEMNLVGPRPLLLEYLPRYNPEQARRHLVKPGITGWAQVNGRNAIDWDQKFVLDVWYVDHQSFWLDLHILFLTIWKVVRRDGISAAEHATMPKFRGNQKPVACSHHDGSAGADATAGQTVA